MSVQATYELAIDWANDGSFATAGDDISDDMRRATIVQGFSDPVTRVATAGRARFLVKNIAKAYSPPLEAAVLPWRPVRFNMTYSATTKTLFRGFIDRIVPAAGEFGTRMAVIECVDAMALLDIFEGRLDLQLNAYADAIISEVVADVYTPPSTNNQAGINQFPTSGEHWTGTVWAAEQAITLAGPMEESVRAANKIQDACIADWGRFFIAKDGAPSFYNRHHMPLATTTALTLNNDMYTMSYEKGISDVYNWVEATYLPRAVGETNEILGRFAPERAARIGPLETDTFIIHYRDTVNQSVRIGGLSVLTPVNGTDYEATDDELGEGADVSANLNVSFTAYANRAEVEIENTHSSTDAYIQFMQVRGRAVRSREPETVRATDATSIAAYGQRILRVNAPLMGNNAQALSLASYLLSVHKDPHDVVRGVEIIGNRSATLMAAVRDLTLMDKVVLSEDQVGLSSFGGHIFNMRHEINDKFDHRLIFDLETPYSVGTPFEIGDTLNSGSVLIY
jgi:hypothetical protein